jgi:hypothetical protein
VPTKTARWLGCEGHVLTKPMLAAKVDSQIYHPTDSAWATWVRRHINMVTFEGLEGPHWTSLQKLLLAYQTLTTVKIHNGHSTSFWKDDWTSCGCLMEMFPALDSHCNSQTISVHDMLAAGVRSTLVPRLSSVATSELRDLEEITAAIDLDTADDVRNCKMVKHGKFSARSVREGCAVEYWVILYGIYIV